LGKENLINEVRVFIENSFLENIHSPDIILRRRLEKAGINMERKFRRYDDFNKAGIWFVQRKLRRIPKKRNRG